MLHYLFRELKCTGYIEIFLVCFPENSRSLEHGKNKSVSNVSAK